MDHSNNAEGNRRSQNGPDHTAAVLKNAPGMGLRTQAQVQSDSGCSPHFFILLTFSTTSNYYLYYFLKCLQNTTKKSTFPPPGQECNTKISLVFPSKQNEFHRSLPVFQPLRDFYLSCTEQFCSLDFSYLCFSLSRLPLHSCLSPGGTGVCVVWGLPCAGV